MLLTGKVAIVTGGTRGIGRAIVQKLAENGADIAILYSGSHDKAKDACATLENMGVRAKAYCCNIADFQQTGDIVKAIVADFGTIDILINNAGITKDGLILSMKEADFDTVIDTNLKGCFNMIKHCTSIFVKKRMGRIVNISSVSGILGNAGQCNYSASKGGLIALTKSIARELASRNVTSNAVAPGMIKTDMTEQMNEQTLSNIVASIPLKRMGTTEDVAELVLFLSSDKAAYITGQVLSVDGGLSM